MLRESDTMHKEFDHEVRLPHWTLQCAYHIGCGRVLKVTCTQRRNGQFVSS